MFVTCSWCPDLSWGIFGQSTKNWVGFFGKWTMRTSLQEFHSVSPPNPPSLSSPPVHWCCPITHHITAPLERKSIRRAAVAANLHKTQASPATLFWLSLHNNAQEAFLRQVARLLMCWLQGGSDHIYLRVFTNLLSCCPPCCCLRPSPCLPASPTPSNPNPNV